MTEELPCVPGEDSIICIYCASIISDPSLPCPVRKEKEEE